MEYPQRKATRLARYDYSTPGVYFITVCTKGKRSILSRIVGGDALIAPQTELLECGRILEEQIRRAAAFYDQIVVEQYVIMPNHVHMLLRVVGNGPTGASAPTRQHQTVPDYISAVKRFCTGVWGEPVFQRSFYDHIIRGEADYQKIACYIAENPARWREDCFYEP